VNDAGQKAITHYQVLHENIEENWSVVECKLETGRMHQIRVHMSHIGHPIIGDDTYGDRSLNSHLRRNYGVNRQFLHSYKISFLHPTKRVLVTFTARLKPDMLAFLGTAPIDDWYKKPNQ